MKLYYSQNSPYARIARIAVLEAGLSDKTEFIEVINRSPDSPLLEFSPVCRVPTLVDGALILGEARNICAYCDKISDTPRFFQSQNQEWQAIGFESMVIGFLDGIATWVRENRRTNSMRSTKLLEVERLRAMRCLKYFENTVTTTPEQFRKWDFCNIALACALSLMNFNSLIKDWQTTNPNLAKWNATQTSRPSMIETAPL